jgi:hypothetical protein
MCTKQAAGSKNAEERLPKGFMKHYRALQRGQSNYKAVHDINLPVCMVENLVMIYWCTK